MCIQTYSRALVEERFPKKTVSVSEKTRFAKQKKKPYYKREKDATSSRLRV